MTTRRSRLPIAVGAAAASSLPENRPLLLVSGATTTVNALAGHPHLGRLLQPRNGNRIDEIATCGMWWAADNDCFQGLDPDAYFTMLNQIAHVDCSRLLWVAVPDVVADAHATLALFRAWLPALRKRRLPAALVAQDGLTVAQVPWDDIACLFIGGSTEWKEGDDVPLLIRAAKARGTLVHVGRVNTMRRLRMFEHLDIDSFDGTQFSWFSQTYPPSWLERLRCRQEAMPEVFG